MYRQIHKNFRQALVSGRRGVGKAFPQDFINKIDYAMSQEGNWYKHSPLYTPLGILIEQIY